jgi:hypothetical protein
MRAWEADVPDEAIPNVVQRVVSGGQTGVDRAALDAAMAVGLPHGGWCPRGRLAEDGRIPARYQLRETVAAEYWIRTEKNVVDSDGTLILYRRELSGGTHLTHRMAVKHGRPFLLIDLDEPPEPHTVLAWIESEGIAVLNVAGPRESSEPGIFRQAGEFLTQVLAPHDRSGK